MEERIKHLKIAYEKFQENRIMLSPKKIKVEQTTSNLWDQL